MVQVTTTSGTYTVPTPTANITVGKSRRKVYDGKVIYLDNNTEFEIELFNSTNNVLAAEILFNGKSISNRKIVLKPGQRVFLDRYIDTPKKFLFETYEVSDTAEVKQAIAKNGDVEIRFYEEYKSPMTWITSTNYWPYFDTGNAGSPHKMYFSSNVGGDTFNCSTNATNTSGSMKLRSATSKSMETGRVEMGSDSEQKFRDVNMNFNSWHTYKTEYKILPTSQMPYTAESMVKYCSSCGRKAKKKDRFCSSCGKKL